MTLKPAPTDIPRYRNEAEERGLWETHDTDGYLDWSKARLVTLLNPQPSTKTNSLQLPEALLNTIRLEANRRDLPYPSLMKIWLAEKIEQVESMRTPKRKRGWVRSAVSPIASSAISRSISGGANGLQRGGKFVTMEIHEKHQIDFVAESGASGLRGISR